MLDEQDKNVIRELQKGLPLVSRPFELIAGRLQMSETELIERVRSFERSGMIRRFGAAVRHHDLGYTANAMVVWDVPDGAVDEVGQSMAAFKEVTHCYQRPRHPGWPYNLFTVVHGRTRDECVQISEKIFKKTNIANYRLLFSTAELKKSSMRYFE